MLMSVELRGIVCVRACWLLCAGDIGGIGGKRKKEERGIEDHIYWGKRERMRMNW